MKSVTHVETSNSHLNNLYIKRDFIKEDIMVIAFVLITFVGAILAYYMPHYFQSGLWETASNLTRLEICLVTAPLGAGVAGLMAVAFCKGWYFYLNHLYKTAVEEKLNEGSINQ